MVEVQIFPYACFFFSKTKYVLPTQLKIERGIPSGPWLRLYAPNAGGINYLPLISGPSLVAQTVKSLVAEWETQVRSLGPEDPLEKDMANPLQYSCLENPMDGGAQSRDPTQVSYIAGRLFTV